MKACTARWWMAALLSASAIPAQAVCGGEGDIPSSIYRYTRGGSYCTSMEEIEATLPAQVRSVYPGVAASSLATFASASVSTAYRPNAATGPSSGALQNPPQSNTPSYRLFVKNQPAAIDPSCASVAPECTAAGCATIEGVRKLAECQFTATWAVSGSLWCWQRTGSATITGSGFTRPPTVTGAGDQNATFFYGPSSSTSLDSGMTVSIPAQSCPPAGLRTDGKALETAAEPLQTKAAQTFSWGMASSNSVSCATGATVSNGAGGPSCGTDYSKWYIKAPAFTQTPGQCGVGNPCFPGNGNKQVDEVGVHYGRINLDLTYNSLRQAGPLAYIDRNWSHAYAKRVITEWMIYGHYASGTGPESGPIANVSGMTVQDERSQIEAYVATSTAGTFRSTGTTGKYLRYIVGATPPQQTWELSYPGGTKEIYDRTGRLVSVIDPVDPRANITLTYDGLPSTGTLNNDPASDDPKFWRIVKITDGTGRFVTLEYENPPVSRLRRVVDDNGVEQAFFGYDGGDRLISMTRFGKTRTYLYNETSRAPLAATVTGYWLTGILDEDERRYATYTYDTWGRANGSWHGTDTDSAGKVTVEYLTDYSSRVTHPLGRVETIAYASDKPYRRMASTTDQAGTVSYEYNNAGRMTASIDRRGTRTEFEYSADGTFETARTEAKGKPEQRRLETDWDAARSLRTAERVYADPPAGPRVLLKDTRYRYEAGSARLIGVDRVDPATAIMRTTSFSYCTATDVTNGATTNCAFAGQLKSVDGPRSDVSDVTQFAYRISDSLAGCGSFAGPCWRKGDLWKTTDALGFVNEVATYDRAGRPVRFVDPNGNISDLTYNVRGWLTERSIRASASGIADPNADTTTQFVYDDSGNVTYLRLPGGQGAYLKYDYDDAHRITAVTDSLGNRMAFTLDREGHRTLEQTLDAGNTVLRTLRREYGALNRLQRVLNAGQQAVATFSGTDASFPGTDSDFLDGYDANGNARRLSDGLGTVTDSRYDALDRLVTVVQDFNASGNPNPTSNATTQFTYDAAGRTTQVLDPDSVPTGYTYNGFDEVTASTSSDAGNRSYLYDPAGNQIRRTDARGIVINSTYDALNRGLDEQAFTMSGLGSMREYDQPDSETGCTGSYPKGRVTRLGDVYGTTTYCYDRRGNVTRKTTQTVYQERTIAYEYTRGDQLKSVTYPDGSIVRYTRDGMRRIVQVTWQANAGAAAQTVVSNVTYYPFGPVKQLTFGNGRTLTKTYDADYNIDSVSSSASSGLGIDFGVDVMGNIQTAVPTGGLGSSLPYQYLHDRLYRLTNVNSGSGTPLETYAYNKTGDRTSKNAGSVLETYGYATNSHRLSSINGGTPRARSSDANGNTTSGIAGAPLQYDDLNRLALAPALSGSANNTYYTYNALQQRVRKQNNTFRGDTWYDESGRRLTDVDYQYLCPPPGQSRPALAADSVVTTDDVPELCPGGGSQLATSLQRTVNYIYLDNLPIAVTEQPAAASTPSLYYLETDHLGTPRVAVEPATGTVKWKWDFFGSTFGEHAPATISGGIRLDMRFPGQFFDAESGLNYNYFRDYEPGAGRYIESDPVVSSP